MSYLTISLFSGGSERLEKVITYGFSIYLKIRKLCLMRFFPIDGRVLFLGTLTYFNILTSIIELYMKWIYLPIKVKGEVSVVWIWIILILYFIFLFFVKANFATIKGGIGEKRVNKLLSQLDPDMYKIYHDLYVTKDDHKTTQIDHIVVSPYGIFVIETKNYDGWIFGDEKSRYWTQVLYKRKEKIFNPIWQNTGHTKALEKYLNLDSERFISIIAFSNQSTFKFKEEFKRTKVIHFRRLLQTIKQYDMTLLENDQLQKIKQNLDRLVITDRKEKSQVQKEHVQTVKQDVGKNKVTLIDRKKCPECGSELVIRRGKYGSFTGCSSYPKCRYTRRMRN